MQDAGKPCGLLSLSLVLYLVTHGSSTKCPMLRKPFRQICIYWEAASPLACPYKYALRHDLDLSHQIFMHDLDLEKAAPATSYQALYVEQHPLRPPWRGGPALGAGYFCTQPLDQEPLTSGSVSVSSGPRGVG